MGHDLSHRGVVMLADGGPGAGLGHLMRSSAVAAALACRGVCAGCLAYGAEAPLEIDGVAWRPLADMAALPMAAGGRVLVLDSYRLAAADAMAAGAVEVVLMHDRDGDARNAALVVAPAAAEPATDRWLTGLEFACLRPHFWGVPARVLHDEIRRVLVTTGGGDPNGRGAKLAETARDALPDASVALVRGPYAQSAVPPGVEAVQANPLLKELLAADIVVSNGGQTMLEAAAAGTPCLALALADNQGSQIARVEAAGAVRVADPSSRAAVAEMLRQLASSPDLRRNMSARAQELIDGYGALRVGFRIARLAHETGSRQ